MTGGIGNGVAAGVDDVGVAVAILAGHAHSVANGTEGIAGGRPLGHAQHALERGRDAEAKARQQGRQSASGDEGQDDEEEDLPRVALGVVLQIAEESLELLDAALDEALARRAFVVRGAAF